jgi:DeoR family transcriptional regulator of aga operon
VDPRNYFYFPSFAFASGVTLNLGKIMTNRNSIARVGGSHPETIATVAPIETGLDGMMAEERRMQILQMVRSAGRVKVNELAVQFNTSAVTIRNDLNDLHQRGLVLRSHGGAVLPDPIHRESPVDERLKAHAAEKLRIGVLAATLINDGETIILDSGTTTLEIARQLKNKQGLQVITNGVNIAAELLDARGVQVFIVGGTVRGESASISGRFAEQMLAEFSADKMFLSGAGCDIDFGVSGGNLEETMVNRAMLSISREIILVADASKFSRRSMARIAPFSEVDTVISDTSLAEDVQVRLRTLGCNLLLA